MKKATRILALLTLLIFVFTTFSFSVSADGAFSDVDSSHQYAEAIQKLYDNKIVDGYVAEDGTRTFKPDNTITRAEFAKLLAVSLVPDQSVLAASPTGFAEVDKDEKISWAIPYIAYAVQQKIVSGYPDGTFQPFKEVTYAEAVKMVVCALGYGSQVETTDPWYEGYLKMGRNVGATANALSDANTASKRGLVAQLIKNLKDVQDKISKLPIVLPDIGGESGGNATIVLPDEDEDVYEGYGQITAIFDSTLSGRLEGLNKREVIIGNVKYTLDSSLSYETFVPYLGYECDFEYKEDGRNKVIRKLTVRNDYEIYEFKDDSNVENVSATQIEFYKKDTDTRTTKLDLTNVRIIYNGYGVQGISNTAKEELFDLSKNTVKFLDNGANRTADVAYVDGFETYFVGGVALDTCIVTDKYRKDGTKSASITLDEDDNVTFKTDAGAESSISALVKDKTTISVFGPYSKNGYTYPDIETYTNVIVSKKTIKGIVSSYDATLGTYTINSKEYKTSPYFAEAKSQDPGQNISVGDNATFYLDHLGRIVCVSVIDSSRYGYITSVEEPDRASKNEYIINMITNTNSANGAQTPTAFTLKDTVTINGKSYNFDQVFPRLKAAADVINAGRTATVGNAEYSQPIIFKTTLDGGTIIRDIRTIASDDPLTGQPYAGESNHIEYGLKRIDSTNESQRRYYSSNVFRQNESSSSTTYMQMRFSTTASTKVFVVPNDRDDDDDYAVYTKSSEVSKYFTTGNTYLVEGFGIESNKYPDILVVYGATPLIIDGKSPAYIVHSKIEKRNPAEDNEDAFELTMYELGKKSPTATVAITLDKTVGADIEPGDVIKYAMRGESIGAIEKIFVRGELYEPFNGADVEGVQSLDSDNDFRTDEKAGETAKYFTSFAGIVYNSDNESTLELIPGFDTSSLETAPGTGGETGTEGDGGTEGEGGTEGDAGTEGGTEGGAEPEGDGSSDGSQAVVPATESYTISTSTYVYIFDGKETSANRLKFVNPQSVQSVVAHGASNAAKVYMYRISGGYIRCIVVYKNVDFIN